MIKPAQGALCLSRLVGGSWFGGTDLRNTGLAFSDLRGADLRMANLRDTGLWDANLEGAYLAEADFGGADLRGACLEHASVYNISFVGADLSTATKYGKEASPLVCALAKVGAPWECINCEWEWRGEWFKPKEHDYWLGLARLYMLGGEDD